MRSRQSPRPSSHSGSVLETQTALRRVVVASERVPSPEHAPGLLPEWLAGRGATAVIAGGMGMRAQRLFAESGITVLTGAPADEPQLIVQAYLDGELELGENVCDH